MTVVAQWAKAPGINGYGAGSIPAVTPRYCTIVTRNVLRSTKKKKIERVGEWKKIILNYLGT